MRMLIESTEKLVRLDGVLCRLWKGTTEDGRDVFVFVHRVGVPLDSEHALFEAELISMPDPERLEAHGEE